MQPNSSAPRDKFGDDLKQKPRLGEQSGFCVSNPE